MKHALPRGQLQLSRLDDSQWNLKPTALFKCSMLEQNKLATDRAVCSSRQRAPLTAATVACVCLYEYA